MKNITYKILVTVFFVTVLSACSDEYFDVNTPSNTATLAQLRIQDLMAPVIHSTMEAQRSAELSFGNYVQNLVGTGGGAAGQTSASGLWSQVYLYILPNLKAIKEKAVEADSKHIGAIADILTAINLGIATDTWDNIPYLDASNGPNNNFPIFDSQESVYNSIFNLLDNAITALSGQDNSGFNLGSSDLIYGGDKQKWLRTAYTVKARYMLHLVNKGSVSANDVLSTIANGYQSDADDFLMYYNEKNINPWYSSEILSRATGNLSNDLASQLVSSMNGDYYPFQGTDVLIDPRLPLFAEIPSADTQYKGFVSGGIGVSPDGSAGNTRFKTDGFYTSIDAPLMLISFAEAKFIEAEAAFLVNGGTLDSKGTNAKAYNAYLEGIKGSMSFYGVSGGAYFSDSAIAVGQSELMLHHILKEKYIHNFLNPETFVDFRRYDFSDKAFKGLKIRLETAADTNEFIGQWFRRAEYPATELARNEANVLTNQKTPVTPVWWDN
jgi:hypothetical protein